MSDKPTSIADGDDESQQDRNVNRLIENVDKLNDVQQRALDKFDSRPDVIYPSPQPLVAPQEPLTQEQVERLRAVWRRVSEAAERAAESSARLQEVTQELLNRLRERDQ